MAQQSSSSEPQSQSTRRQAQASGKLMDGDKITPKVTSVVPALFVPLDRDITQPFEAPRDRIERAKSVLNSIEFHKAGVREGILHLEELERRRILRIAADWEAEHGVPNNPAGLSPDETEDMISSMCGEALPGVDYNVKTEELTPDFNAAADRPDREDTVRQLQRVVEDGVTHLAGYESYMDTINKRWTEVLDKEQRLMDTRFGPKVRDKDGDGDVVMR